MIAKTHWPAESLWLVLALGEAVILARMATWAQRTLVASPLSPIVLGAACGMATAVLANYFAGSSSRRVRWGCIAIALACIAAEHGFFYFDYREGFASALSTSENPLAIQLAKHAQPLAFGEFMAAGAQRQFGILPGWLWWIVDAGLTIVASVAVGTIIDGSARNGARGETAGR